jgi:hypothetical protein
VDDLDALLKQIDALRADPDSRPADIARVKAKIDRVIERRNARLRVIERRNARLQRGPAQHWHPMEDPANWWSPDRQAPAEPRGSSRRTIPQAVKVAVAARDNGRCQCVARGCHGHSGMCGSTVEPHFDHVTPWSKGGTDTVGNLQILCGPCNRRKGADNIT